SDHARERPSQVSAKCAWGDQREKQMKLFASAAVLALLASPAFAQSGSQPSTTSPTTENTNQNVAAAQKIKQDLTSAGFTDVKVVAESFVVQAKSKDGDPVLMTIGPHGMSVFEAMNSNSNSDTTGSTAARPNGANSGSASQSATPPGTSK